MTSTLTFFVQSDLLSLELIVASFQEEFDILLKDLFSENELEKLESKIESIGAIYVQPLSPELSFDDFYFNQVHEEGQRKFFNTCRSSLCIENLPFLETNPFQVTYLTDLVKKFDEVLIDRGGVHELLFKERFQKELASFKNIYSLINEKEAIRPVVKTSVPLTPIDFILRDIYLERDRLKNSLPSSEGLSTKVEKIYRLVSHEKLNSDELYQKSGLNAKDFGDCLERLKFWLKSFPS